MKLNKGFFLLNVVVIIAMIVHVGIKIYLHSKHPEYSAPAYSQLLICLYYVIPLALLNIIRLFLRGKRR